MKKKEKKCKLRLIVGQRRKKKGYRGERKGPKTIGPIRSAISRRKVSPSHHRITSASHTKIKDVSTIVRRMERKASSGSTSVTKKTGHDIKKKNRGRISETWGKKATLNNSI